MGDSQQLKSAGLKITAPRMKILEILERSNTRHLSAEDVYKKLLELGEEVALATVYRVLGQFENAGLIVRHYFESDYSVYELRQEKHHDHLICSECGRIEEFVDEIIERRQKLIADKAQFKMTGHALTIHGLCPSCV